MKKQVRAAIIATIVTTIIMCSCTYLLPVYADGIGDRGEFYPRLTIVVGVEQIEETGLWIISCIDRFGNIWEFFADSDEWSVGDLANLLMWKINENEEEDEIVEVYWEGYFETENWQ